jgi:PhzF family phenazine biosynthesis protein
MSELPIQIVSTGLKDIMIPIRNYKDLQSIQPDFEKIKQVSRKYDTVGYHLFTLEPVHQEAIAHCRNFAPLYGIKEESATGTSNAALAAYLFQYKRIKPNERNLKFEQGYGMDEPSEILVRLDTNKDSITNIMVGGYGSIIEEREVDLHKS